MLLIIISDFSRREKTERDTLMFIVFSFFLWLFLTRIIRCLEFKQQNMTCQKTDMINRCYYVRFLKKKNSCIHILVDECTISLRVQVWYLCKFLPVHIRSENFYFS